jgi:hypothetical protein
VLYAQPISASDSLNRQYGRFYQLARKHCGHQPKWKISLKRLHEKSGSRATAIKFREMVKRAAATNALPDYRLSYDIEADQVIFCTKDEHHLAVAPTANRLGYSGY